MGSEVHSLMYISLPPSIPERSPRVKPNEHLWLFCWFQVKECKLKNIVLAIFSENYHQASKYVLSSPSNFLKSVSLIHDFNKKMQRMSIYACYTSGRLTQGIVRSNTFPLQNHRTWAGYHGSWLWGCRCNLQSGWHDELQAVCGSSWRWSTAEAALPFHVKD